MNNEMHPFMPLRPNTPDIFDFGEAVCVTSRQVTSTLERMRYHYAELQHKLDTANKVNGELLLRIKELEQILAQYTRDETGEMTLARVYG